MVTGTGTQPTAASAAAVDNVEPQPRRTSSDNRRSNKPIMEKRRRARINNCLNELKTLILDAMKKDPARHSKLEKADILEMTVKHLENLQRQQAAMSAAADPNVVNKFRAGFSECASEVGRFPGLDPTIKRRLLQHLAGCLAGANLSKQDGGAANAPSHPPPVQVHILPSPPQNSAEATGGIIFTNGASGGVQLVPTRLPNGDIALVLPTTATTQQHQHHQQNPSQLPTLVPIPTRTASTASASSSASSSASYSSPESPEPMDTSSVAAAVPQYNSPPSQMPLSLVVRKTPPADDGERPWRPW